MKAYRFGANWKSEDDLSRDAKTAKTASCFGKRRQCCSFRV